MASTPACLGEKRGGKGLYRLYRVNSERFATLGVAPCSKRRKGQVASPGGLPAAREQQIAEHAVAVATARFAPSHSRVVLGKLVRGVGPTRLVVGRAPC